MKQAGLVLHHAGWYDFTVWLMTLGREGVFRKKVLQLARLKAGESVLDVGCGTGTLAIAAAERVGPSGRVDAIDASPQMLTRARRKADKAGIAVNFQAAQAQALPYPDSHFDAVLSTVMFHHLPRPAREQCASEIRRVLKPAGRALIVDFAAPGKNKQHVLPHLHRHGHLSEEDLAALVGKAGLTILESGTLDFRNMHFVRAARPPD